MKKDLIILIYTIGIISILILTVLFMMHSKTFIFPLIMCVANFLLLSIMCGHIKAKMNKHDGKERLEYLEHLINNPELDNFLEGIKLESAHQTERWGLPQEESKYPHDYALVLDKLKGKLAVAVFDKDVEKYKHHLITIAAVCYNIHRQIDKDGTRINQFFK